MEEHVKTGGSASPAGTPTIRGKIWRGFLLMLAMTAVVVVVALVGQRYITTSVIEKGQQQNRLVQLGLEAQSQLDRMLLEDSRLRQYLVRDGLQAVRDTYLPGFTDAAVQARDRIETMARLAPEQQTQRALDALNSYTSGLNLAVASLDQKFDPESGLLARIDKHLTALRGLVAAPTVSADVQAVFQTLRGHYYTYLTQPSEQVAEQVQEAVAAFRSRTSKLGAEQQVASLNRLNGQFLQDFTLLVKADEEIRGQFASAEASAALASPALQSLRDEALARQTRTNERLQRISSVVRTVLLAVGILALLLGLILAAGISGGLSRQIGRIMRVLDEVNIGNFNARAEIVSQDEMGEMATSLNSMLDNVTMLLHSQEEQDTVQESFMKLMMEISELTEGNLTVRAEVTEDVTGALADTFNTMAEQFGDIVRQVKGATNAVDETVADVSRLTSDLAVRSIEQNRQVNEAIESIQNIAESIRQVSQNAARSAEVSLASRMNAREGAEAVEQTNRAMDEIREQINETARSIKRLGESSMEIGNVVEIINSIADRTSILALNASIQAAMAGEAGHGFAVVAEEVQRLAESSSNSTKQIETLIKSIQAEIKDAGNRMDESISKVVQGSQLADGAYAKLQEIESVSNQLADLIESITRSAADQVQRSERAVESMVAVGEISTSTADSTQETDNLMSVLNETARALRQAVDTFKTEAV